MKGNCSSLSTNLEQERRISDAEKRLSLQFWVQIKAHAQQSFFFFFIIILDNAGNLSTKEPFGLASSQ